MALFVPLTRSGYAVPDVRCPALTTANMECACVQKNISIPLPPPFWAGERLCRCCVDDGGLVSGKHTSRNQATVYEGVGAEVVIGNEMKRLQKRGKELTAF